MAIGIDVFRRLRYAGPGCDHDVILRAGRPSYSNADQAAADAADAFVGSAHEHLRGWWETWRLPRLCSAEHAIAIDTTSEDEISDDADHEALTGPGFRWVDVAFAGERLHAYLLADAGRDGDLRDG
jgi:hypothetical protein